MENVSNLRGIAKGKLLGDIQDEIGRIGYNFTSNVLCAADYGAPQLRRRLVFIGVRKPYEPVHAPLPTHGDVADNLFVKKPYVGVGEAFEGLPPVDHVDWDSTFSFRPVVREAVSRRARYKARRGDNVDRVSKETRSMIMSRVRSTGNRTTEARLRAYLVQRGIRGWRVRPSGIEGKPDFVFEWPRLAIFVDGSFWHGAPGFTRFPKSRTDYWKPKIERNRERDRQVTNSLRRRGWAVMRFWDSELSENPMALVKAIVKKLEARTRALNQQERDLVRG